MLDVAERQFVESIRDAKSVRIVINQGMDNEREFLVNDKEYDISQFRRNLRYTLQDYINECNLSMRRMQLRNRVAGGIVNKSERK